MFLSGTGTPTGRHASMDSFTYEDLITIVVALDNEAHSRHDSEASELRRLKWRVFALAAEKKMQEGNGLPEMGISNKEGR